MANPGLEGLLRQVRELTDPEAVAARVDPMGFADAVAETVRALAANPVPATAAAAALAADATRAVAAGMARAVGGEAAGPAEPPADRRHRDPAWDDNAWYFTWRQQHALFADWARAVTAALDLEPATRRKIEFLVGQTVEAADPANWPWSNPAVPAAALASGGLSVLRGARNMVRDLVVGGGLPRQVPPDALVVGRDLAATPGKVVHRNRLMELIQFEPGTDQVHETPLLLSPPWINKYYVMDLAPGKSFAQWAVDHGRTVFAISYRDPDSALRDVTMSDYLREGPLAALDVVEEITGAPRVDLVALCLGGTLAVAAAAWLAARGEDRIGTLTLVNTLLDFAEPGPLGVFTDARTVARLDRMMQPTGYLPAQAMKATFDALRPTDLVWRYVVDGWWLGRDPKAFDLLAWNADSTRMPAAMQTEYLRTCYVENRLVAGTMELAGERLDLGAVRHDAYVVGAETDHIAPWRSVYAGARRLGGDVRFVLSNSGHIAGMVNPPSPRSAHRIGPGGEPAESAAEWFDTAELHRRSWWEDWARWAAERAGPLSPPPRLGSAAHPVLDDAPGRYVRGEEEPAGNR